MGSKSIVTAGFVWLVLVCFLGFIFLALPNKKSVKQQVVSSNHTSSQLVKRPLVKRRIPTPTQSISTQVRVVKNKAELKTVRDVSGESTSGEVAASRVKIGR